MDKADKKFKVLCQLTENHSAPLSLLQSEPISLSHAAAFNQAAELQRLSSCKKAKSKLIIVLLNPLQGVLLTFKVV